VEVLTLDCRGNNHGALALYASLGFVTTGRRPDVIAVGQHRFDQVLLHLDLRAGPGDDIRHGSRREGPGAT
jgi:ribosomal protein S18 acetylase RimI-like enzyme